jgi:hypothetical protein
MSVEVLIKNLKVSLKSFLFVVMLIVFPVTLNQFINNNNANDFFGILHHTFIHIKISTTQVTNHKRRIKNSTERVILYPHRV